MFATGACPLNIQAGLNVTRTADQAPSPRVGRNAAMGTLGFEETALRRGHPQWALGYLWSDRYPWSDGGVDADGYHWSDGYLWADGYLWPDGSTASDNARRDDGSETQVMGGGP